MLVERAHQSEAEQPGQSLCLPNATRGNNQIYKLWAVFVQARTLGLIQAALEKRANLQGVSEGVRPSAGTCDKR